MNDADKAAIEACLLFLAMLLAFSVFLGSVIVSNEPQPEVQHQRIPKDSPI